VITVKFPDESTNLAQNLHMLSGRS